MRQQGVSLPLDKLAVLAFQSGVLAAAHLVHGLAEMPQGMKLVVQDCGAVHVRRTGIAERLPHVHDHQTDFAALLLSKPFKEQIHTGFRTVRAPKPDWALPNQIAHNDAVGVPLSDGDLVDPDDLRTRRSRSPQLRLHVLLLQRLDRLPVQVGLPGDIPDRRDTAPASHPEGKALRIKRVVGQPLQALLLHFPATPAQNASDLHIQPDATVATRQIPNPSHLAVVKHPVCPSAGSAKRFFPRRRSLMTRAFGSPKIPDTSVSGVNPGNRYASHNRFVFRMRSSYHILSAISRVQTLAGQALAT